MLKRSVVLIAMFLLLPLAAFAAGAPATIKGSFTQVPGKEFKFDGKTVEVIEFLSFYCDHCYQFEKAIPAIKGNFPKKVKWKIVPLYWGQSSSKPGEAYLIAADAGKGEEMKRALFNANFVEKKDIGSVEVLEAIASKIGLGFDFSRKLRGGEKAKEAGKALDAAQEYRVEETPTVVIAGNIMTNPHASGHDLEDFKKNIITIMKSLFEK
ncbi:MAG: hypothetical protein A2X99_06950 [Deltaproteobacteria bacterium GWB2_55_19]|nr:MAG: hypothetical protein A2X99_06950 [Deltaproteobacteria bacterium GWB2_55_19]HAO92994.1 hypothetical protein [Deltaproteobacteria bacterium]